ncbi:hypothetical protein WN943_001844 [Citrus x changshan-huyou]
MAKGRMKREMESHKRRDWKGSLLSKKKKARKMRNEESVKAIKRESFVSF